MSFDQLSSMESQPRRGNAGPGDYSDDPDFQRMAQGLMNQIFNITGNIARLSTEIGHLGTRRDTARVRERVHELLEETRDKLKEVGEGVKKVQSWEDVTPSQKYTQQKLSRELQSSLTEFQTLQRLALEKQRASISAAKAAGGSDDYSAPGQYSDHQQGQLQEQQQAELSHLAPQDEVDFQEALIIEREEEIRNIEQGVGDLNVLFQQVAQIVTEQGDQIDTIADNVENVRDDTRGADYELRSAARYQKNARSKACCLLLVLVIIVVIVVLAIVLA